MGDQDNDANDKTTSDTEEIQKLIDKWGDDVSAKGLTNDQLETRSRERKGGTKD
jgi:hypothetical protein